jgi:valyl-tRNA synthetase
MVQDPDTLDTWFSSALWPFATLGWPEKTEDLEYFYPTNTLVTGYDIIFFWVVRMMFSGIEHMGKAPFNTVLIHGLVRDAQGRKMSKSLGNGIDPLDIIENFGADALRFMLVTGSSPGADMRFSEEKVKAARGFANKLWNASRYIIMNLPDGFRAELPPIEELETEDKWVIGKYNVLIKDVKDNLDKFELGMAAGKLYDFIWDIYCDWYIELTKPRITEGGKTAETAQKVLVWIMEGILKILHPFMPFITEEIFQILRGDDCQNQGQPLMLQQMPEYAENLKFENEDKEFSKVINLIKAVRNTRTQLGIPQSTKTTLFIETAETELFSACVPFFIKLAGASEVEVCNNAPLKPEDAATAVTDSARALMPRSEFVDNEKELARLLKEKNNVQNDIDFLAGKLSNTGFTAKAPPHLIEKEKEKLAKAEEQMRKLEMSIKALQGSGL